jgi:peroxiredoxin
LHSFLKVFVSAAVALGLMLAAFSEGREFPPDPWQIRPLLTGASVPPFTARAPDGSPWTFDPESLEGPVILTFYRGSWCPYCTRHLMEYRTIENDLLQLGYRLVFLSPDRPEVLRAEQGQEPLSYELVSDSRMAAAEALGVAFRLDDATAARYREAGVDLAEASGERHGLLPVPSTWIIGADGVIDYAFVNPDYKVRVAPGVVMAAARAAVQPAGE